MPPVTLVLLHFPDHLCYLVLVPNLAKFVAGSVPLFTVLEVCLFILMLMLLRVIQVWGFLTKLRVAVCVRMQVTPCLFTERRSVKSVVVNE
jgi:hypothetical protein